MSTKPEVVISGIAGRFPQSDDIEKFKENLFNGIDMVTADDLRWPPGMWHLPTRNGKVTCMDRFDLDFFDVCPDEVRFVDPQDRLLLETTYEAVLDAGFDPRKLKGSNTGYFHGSCYVECNKDFDDPSKCPTYWKSLVTRVPRFFGLKGPILDVDTACGSGLSAFSEAFYSIKNGLCDQAIATASNTVFRPRISVQFRDLKMITKDGKCKCLDSSADGYVRSEAIVATFLQKAPDSKRIYATLLNCKSNSDGYKEEGITFPSVKGQIQLLNDTYREAGIDPGDIGYIEAHITGTKAGDPVEMNAMYDVICTKRKDPVLLGCLKSNIGHTEGSSGLCAIAKALIVYQTKLIPPNLHYNVPNMALKGLTNGKMVPVTRVTPFTGNLIPVNCFGFGGANTHLITRGYTGRVDGNRAICDPIPRIVQICGRTREAVEYIASSLKTKPMYLTCEFLSLLNDYSKLSPADRFEYRGYTVIQQKGRKYIFHSSKPMLVTPKPIWLVFEGPGECLMTADELLAMPVVNEKVNQLNIFMKKAVHVDLLDGLRGSSLQVILALNVAIQVGCADLLKLLGVKPVGIIGHSTGELAAAYFDGCLSAEQAVMCAYYTGYNYENQWALQQQLKTIIKSSRVRSSIWHSSGLSTVCAEYFEGRLLNAKKDKKVPNGVIAVNVTNIGLSTPGDKGETFPINTLKVLGDFYVNGMSVNIEQFYPKVTYPVPSSTPFLSPLIQWDHRIPCPISEYLVGTNTQSWQTTKNIVFRYDRSQTENSFLFDHKIDGRVLFPATGYLMIVWVTLCQICKEMIMDLPVKFENVTFIRATVMSETKEVILSVRINEDTGCFEVKEGDNAIVTGLIKRIDGQRWEQPTADEEHSSDSVLLEAKDIYKELGVRGYDYGPYFQGLAEATSDGRRGQVMWRDIVAKKVRDSMILETDEEVNLLWVKSWVPFVDSLFQLQLLQEKNDSRCLVVPTFIQSLTCDPSILKREMDLRPKITDPVSQNQATLMDGYVDHVLNEVYTNGIVVKGLKASLLSRRKQLVRLQKYQFVPLNDDAAVDTSDLKRVEDYANEVLSLARKEKSQPSHDLDNDQHALLKLITKSDDNNNINSDVSLESDLLVGNYDNDWYYNQRFIKTQLDLIVYNLIASSSRHTLEILEVNSTSYVMSKQICEYLDECVLYNQLTVNYSLLHPDPSALESNRPSGVKDIIQWKGSTLDVPAAHLVVYRFDDKQDNSQLIPELYRILKEGGFLLVLYKDRIDPQIEAILKKFDKKEATNYTLPSTIIEPAQEAGFLLIAQKKVMGSTLPLSSVLFRKQTKSLSSEDHVAVEVGLSDYDQWLDKLKLILVNQSDDGKVWLVPKYEEGLRSPFGTQVTGLLGFVKSLRLESGGARVRCLIDWTSRGSVNLNTEKYADILRKDLVYNIMYDEDQGWGSFEHMFLPQEVAFDTEAVQPAEDVYLKTLKPGDMSSLRWVKSSLASDASANRVQVYYAPLNFKDIMFASGRLSPEAIPFVSPLVAQDSLLGLEYAGRDRNGRRVMGIVPYQALATTVAVKEEGEDFMWPIPEDWSMEEAATVPVVYATAFYALIIRGVLVPGESVLIHAGAGGVGLAAINLCISKKCTVYTTVGSKAKRDFLLEEYGASGLIDEHIFNSRDTLFEDQLLRLTDGRGVDVILNSLADEKLQASLRCLAPNGRFLEIGKMDFVQNKPLYPHQLDNNRTLHGVFLDILTKYSEDDYFPDKVVSEKKLLTQLVLDGIRIGVVKPLKRTIFDKDRVEEAFRFMSTGKHIGKVVIKVRDEEKRNGSGTQELANFRVQVDAVKATHFNPSKSYVVVGGLGGFGLELVQWLAQKGAKYIVANSRRGVRESYQKHVVTRLQKQGIKLIISQTDSTRQSGAKRLLEEATCLAPVGGIFNSAVVYNDVLFSDQTVDIFEQVCAPKATSTYFLDSASRKMCPALDYFVTFSSISAGRGNEGQTNYNFANSLMDSICEARRAKGLPGLSIQWGVIGDVGLLAEKSPGSSEVVLLGAASQRIHSCFEALDRLLQSNHAVVSSLVKPSSTSSGSKGGQDLLKIISNIIGLKDISHLDQSISLGGLGIDSLIAVEIKQVIESVTGTSYGLKEVRELTIANVIQLSTSSQS